MIDPKEQKPKTSIHSILAHSYMAYFALFLLGLLLHTYFSIKIYNNNLVTFISFLFLFFGTFLVLWAQHTSKKLDKSNITKETFCQGPYCYVRMPTHLGLFILMLGLGLLVNSLFIVLFSIVSFLINKFYFIKKEEDLLSSKYGSPYLEYKKSVRF
ncbi:hypothetical protein COU49_01505 [Candidatus Nomurabacteria bacterium CG10_big_fil_rev_8_21_14_0_10_35_16]|uniref:Isoprenylcysteine carboxylmethyltransferase family protein n=1 Tax=Candidatus Nomurabacteria bacterium CG10_big_fil_rev_8_21_14_0_10_35_16 TaxID=1974731 RepID=A0A2H0TDM0_9BACT|nr:MAG: hypothetical protein COU49_01505 [Candidatus Nomurabacteria bacterium CG10_big_fil_rev_8_21_14_0_10_35_16]